MIAWFLGTRLGRLISAAVAGAAVVLGVWGAGKRQGRSDARREAIEDDFENAADIRDRVERDLDKRVREFDGRGFRDEQ